MFGGSGGAGLTVYLRSASSTNRVPGARGSLGYGPDRAQSPQVDGLPGGLVGE